MALFAREEVNERLNCLNYMNNSDFSIPNVTLKRFPERICQKFPSNIAMIYEGYEYTYQTLNHDANQFVHYLRLCGIRQGDAIGLYLEPSYLQNVSLLAILKMGGTYVPLSSHLPNKKLERIIQQVNAKALIVEDLSSKSQCLTNLPLQLICWHKDYEKIKKCPNDKPQFISNKENKNTLSLCLNEKLADKLTNREIEILSLWISGISIKQAARIMKISARTVEKFRFNIRLKMKLKNRQSIIEFIHSLDVFELFLQLSTFLQNKIPF